MKFFPKAEVFEIQCIDDFVQLVCHEKHEQIIAQPTEWLMVIDIGCAFTKSWQSPIKSDGGFYVLRAMEAAGLTCPALFVSSAGEPGKVSDYKFYIGCINYSHWEDLMEEFWEVLGDLMRR